MSPGPVPKDTDSSWATHSRRSSPSASRKGKPAPWTNDCRRELNWPEERRIGQNDIRGLPCPHLPKAPRKASHSKLTYHIGWDGLTTRRKSQGQLWPPESSHGKRMPFAVRA